MLEDEFSIGTLNFVLSLLPSRSYILSLLTQCISFRVFILVIKCTHKIQGFE